MILGPVIALLLMINSPSTAPTLDDKHATGHEICQGVMDEFDYDACMVEISADEQRMWLHLMCFIYDPITERGVYDEYAIVRLDWVEPNAWQVTAVPPELGDGCPVYE